MERRNGEKRGSYREERFRKNMDLWKTGWDPRVKVESGIGP